MDRVKRFLSDDGKNEQYWFWCPGCRGYHAFTTAHARAGVWTFNGNTENPTFAPSLLVNGGNPEKRCHLFLRNGMIEFLGDCWHSLAGTTVECPEWEE